MAILERLLGGGRRQSLATYNDERFWRSVGFMGEATASKQTVNEVTALNCSVVYRCISLIAGSLSMLPVHVYRRVSDSQRQRVASHLVETLMNDEPNSNMDGPTLREAITGNVLGWGNGYCEVSRVGGSPISVYPLRPEKVTPDINEAGEIVYRVRKANGGEDVLDRSQVLHVKNIGGDGLVGWSVIRLAKESIGLGLAAEKYGAGFFGNSAKPSGIVKRTIPGDPADKAIERFRETWNKEHGGKPSVGFLKYGWDWVSTTITPEDSQFLGTRQFQIPEICRWFGVPAHLAGDLSRATNNNIEQQSLEFLTYCLLYWIRKWECAINLGLFTREERADGLYAEFQVNTLLRADAKTRLEAHAIARNSLGRSLNEIYAAENWNGIGPVGDVRLAPANMLPLDEFTPEAREKARAAGQQQPSAGPGENGGGANNSPRKPAPTPTNQSGERPTGAHRQLLSDAIGRLLRKEMKNLSQIARKGGDFLGAVDLWVLKFKDEVRDSLALPVSVIPGIGEAGAIAVCVRTSEKMAEATRAVMLDVAGAATAKNLAAKVDETLAAWEDRAGPIVEGILNASINPG